VAQRTDRSNRIVHEWVAWQEPSAKRAIIESETRSGPKESFAHSVRNGSGLDKGLSAARTIVDDDSGAARLPLIPGKVFAWQSGPRTQQ
jgi:hypothetical protein